MSSATADELRKLAAEAERSAERRHTLQMIWAKLEDGILDPKKVIDTVREYMRLSGKAPVPEAPHQAPIEKVERRHGVKLDAGKPPIWRGFIQSFPRGIEEVAVVTMEGCNEPGHVYGGWLSVTDGYARYSDAMGRHQLEEARLPLPTDIVQQNKMIKVCATVAWNDMARLEHLIRDFRE